MRTSHRIRIAREKKIFWIDKIDYNYHFSFLFFFFFWDRILPCIPGWPQTYDLPALAFQVLELQKCAATPSYYHLFVLKFIHIFNGCIVSTLCFAPLSLWISMDGNLNLNTIFHYYEHHYNNLVWSLWTHP
jgi:hypothetical protein